jgi:hypothetical protein
MGLGGNSRTATEETEVSMNMRFVSKMRFIPTSVHGAVDQVVAPALVIAPAILRLGRTSPESIVARAVGASEALYSNLTNYEPSAKKVVPMRVHLALDAVSGTTLALLPQLTGARGRGKKHWLPHLTIGALEVGMAALTKTEPPKSGRRAQIAKLVETAKRARSSASDAVKAVA